MECIHETRKRCRSVGLLLRVFGETRSADASRIACSKATSGTTESAIMYELRDMKNNFRG